MAKPTNPFPVPASQPATLPALLRYLGIQHATVEEHRRILTRWLQHNTPAPSLRLSLRANGYGLLLPSAPSPLRPLLSGLSAAMAVQRMRAASDDHAGAREQTSHVITVQRRLALDAS
ncbi:hypothetical protein [Mycobacterium intracellulare]|uniref:hypothetical protein n=1 Tax=Mycobacterium intracellulare TaxID=1767 RepID=UPI0010421310|nr:hypothetical protein [Mycobacterium intracellulare]